MSYDDKSLPTRMDLIIESLILMVFVGSLVFVSCGIWGGDIDINHMMGR